MFEFITERDAIRNHHSRLTDALVKTFSDEKVNTFRKLIPLDKIQKKLERQVHVLTLQLELLNNYLALDAKEQGSADLNLQYQQQFSTLQQTFILSYSDLMDARDEIFEDNKFIDLTDENRPLYLEKFQQETEAEMQAYQQFRFHSEPAALQEQQSYLEGLLEENEKLMAYFMDHHTEQAMKWQDRAAFFSNQQVNISSKQAAAFNADEQSIMNLCIEGNLPVIKAKLEKLSTKDRKKMLNDIESGRGFLHNACLYGHLEVVAYLLKSGAEVHLKDTAGYLALHYLFAQAHPIDVTEAILNLLTKENKAIDVRGPYGRVPLHTAALFNNLEGAMLLLNRGANPNSQESESPRRTPLHNAAMRGHVDMVKLLLDSKADPHIKNQGNESAIYEAVLEGKTIVSREFYNRGHWVDAEEKVRLVKVAKKSDKIKEAFYRPPFDDICPILKHEELQRPFAEAGAQSFFQGASSSSRSLASSAVAAEQATEKTMFSSSHL